MWVAQYDINVDGYRAANIAPADKRNWHYAIGDEAAAKLTRIGVLPCGWRSSDDVDNLEARIMAYPESEGGAAA